MANATLLVPSTAPTTAVNNIPSNPFSGTENYWVIQLSGASVTGLQFTVQATLDGVNWANIAVLDLNTGATISGGSTISPSSGVVYQWAIPNAQGLVGIQITPAAISASTATFLVVTKSTVNGPAYLNIAGSLTSFTSITTSGNLSVGGTASVTGNTTLSGTLGVTGATTLSSTLAVTGNVTINSTKVVITASSGNILSLGSILTGSSTGGIGYATGDGAGSAVTQTTSRTTGVTINTPTGQITLVSAAGSATPFSMVVTNSSVLATDTIVTSVKSSTDKYSVAVTAVAATSFTLTVTDLTGTTTEQPVISYAILRGAAT